VNLTEIMKGPIIRQYVLRNETNKLLTLRFSLKMNETLVN